MPPKNSRSTFEQHVAAQFLKMLGQERKPKKGRVMYAVLGKLLTTDKEGSDNVEIKAECIRFCETKKEAENCDLGGDFADADVTVYDLDDEDELKTFLGDITPQADYASFFIHDEDEEE